MIRLWLICFGKIYREVRRGKGGNGERKMCVHMVCGWTDNTRKVRRDVWRDPPWPAGTNETPLWDPWDFGRRLRNESTIHACLYIFKQSPRLYICTCIIQRHRSRYKNNLVNLVKLQNMKTFFYYNFWSTIFGFEKSDFKNIWEFWV